MSEGTRRRKVMTTHRARPTQAAERTGDRMEGYELEYKEAYIEFINKLMARMKMNSIERMLEAALKETK